MKKKKPNKKPDRLKNIEGRLAQMEEAFRHFSPWLQWLQLLEKRTDPREATVDPWQFLVRRQHPWRKQLYIKGRNLTARQLVGSIKANRLDDEKAAANYHLPVEAIREALSYVERNQHLLETESEIERLMSEREGDARVHQPLS